MDRRTLLAGAAATTSFLAVASTASATSSGIDEDKLPVLMGGDFATASSQLALERASNSAVRTFAELEIAEQAAVAMAFGSEPGAAGMSEEHTAMLAELEAAEGADFDMMYIEGQIAGHEELLALNRDYAESGDDPMARGASMVGVPAIQTHLSLLQSIRASLG